MRSPTPNNLNEQHVWGGNTYQLQKSMGNSDQMTQTTLVGQQVQAGAPSSQGIIASHSDDLFFSTNGHDINSSHPYKLPDIPFHHIHPSNTAYNQPFSHQS